MRRALLILLPLLMGAASGTARVIDGDTLELTDGQKLRLWGIDAPESSQRCQRYGRPWYCGNDAAAALEALVAGRKLTCDAHGWDQYGRVVAICRLDGADIGAELVRQGWALDYADHSAATMPTSNSRRSDPDGACGREASSRHGSRASGAN